MPVFLHKADMMEENIQSPAHPLCIFCILYNRTESCFISKVPVFHKHTDDIITWATNMISLWTKFQPPGDFKYIQIILNVMLRKIHPDNVKMSHATHNQILWTEFLLTMTGYIKFSSSLDLQTATCYWTKILSWNIFNDKPKWLPDQSAWMHFTSWQIFYLLQDRQFYRLLTVPTIG